MSQNYQHNAKNIKNELRTKFNIRKSKYVFSQEINSYSQMKIGFPLSLSAIIKYMILRLHDKPSCVEINNSNLSYIGN